jgi:hypothetical protein
LKNTKLIPRQIVSQQPENDSDIFERDPMYMSEEEEEEKDPDRISMLQTIS